MTLPVSVFLQEIKKTDQSGVHNNATLLVQILCVMLVGEVGEGSVVRGW